MAAPYLIRHQMSYIRGEQPGTGSDAHADADKKQPKFETDKADRALANTPTGGSSVEMPQQSSARSPTTPGEPEEALRQPETERTPAKKQLAALSPAKQGVQRKTSPKKARAPKKHGRPDSKKMGRSAVEKKSKAKPNASTTSLTNNKPTDELDEVEAMLRTVVDKAMEEKDREIDEMDLNTVNFPALLRESFLNPFLASSSNGVAEPSRSDGGA